MFGVIASPLEDSSRNPTHAQDSETCADIAEALTWLGHRFVCLRADSDLDVSLRAHQVEACVLALHGNSGGVGTVQALLELRQIQFIGPNSNATSTAYNKVRTRQLLGYHNLPVPVSIAVEKGNLPSQAARQLLGQPYVIKPQLGALGCGVFRIESASDLERASQYYQNNPQDGILERFVEGPELQVVLLGGRVVGIMEVESEFASNGTNANAMYCPPRLSRGQIDSISRLAKRATQVLGLDNCLSRVDILLSHRHNEIILEVEALPPLHKNSVVARVFRSVGLSYEQLISAALTTKAAGSHAWPFASQLSPAQSTSRL